MKWLNRCRLLDALVWYDVQLWLAGVAVVPLHQRRARRRHYEFVRELQSLNRSPKVANLSLDIHDGSPPTQVVGCRYSKETAVLSIPCLHLGTNRAAGSRGWRA